MLNKPEATNTRGCTMVPVTRSGIRQPRAVWVGQRDTIRQDAKWSNDGQS